MSTTPTQQPAPEDNSKSLILARRYAQLLEPIPTRLLFAIKTLRKHYLEGFAKGKPLENSRNVYAPVRLIDHMPSLKVPIYFAASQMYPDKFTVMEDDVSKALVDILGTGLFGSMLTVIYLYRRISKLTKDDIWHDLSEDLLIDMELGFMLGSAVKRIGPADGMLIGAMRQLAIATFMLRDPETYKRYRNSQKTKINREWELSKFGCDHSQVALYILLLTGYWQSKGENAVQRSQLSICDSLIGKYPRINSGDPVLEAWTNTVYWIDRIRSSSSKLESTNDKKLDDELGNLLKVAKALINNGSTFKWMKRSYNGTDLEDEIHKFKQTHPSEQPDLESINSDLPEVDEESLSELSQEDLDALQAAGEQYKE